MPSSRNTRDEDPELAAVVNELQAAGMRVVQIEQERKVARAARRKAAAEAFSAGVSWRKIADYASYGSAQAAQQDVTTNSTLNRRSGD